MSHKSYHWQHIYRVIVGWKGVAMHMVEYKTFPSLNVLRLLILYLSSGLSLKVFYFILFWWQVLEGSIIKVTTIYLASTMYPKGYTEIYIS